MSKAISSKAEKTAYKSYLRKTYIYLSFPPIVKLLPFIQFFIAKFLYTSIHFLFLLKFAMDQNSKINEQENDF